MDAREFLDTRRADWHELERLLVEVGSRRARRGAARDVLRLARLYRNTCADLALANAYRLPDETVEFLRNLVARAHGQFYGSRPVRWNAWLARALVDVPSRLYRDRFLRVSATVFFGVFLLAGVASALNSDFARSLVGAELLEMMETMHGSREPGRDTEVSAAMTGFYIQHNVTIGLQCFTWGIFFGLGTLYALVSNALILGTVFGHIATTDAAQPFYEFVTAHAPFELTAIALAGAAGLRLGFSLVATGGASRRASLQKAGAECVPVLVSSVTLLALAAVIEAYVSPSDAPYWAKATVGILSAIALAFYLVLGRPRRSPRADRALHASHP